MSYHVQHARGGTSGDYNDRAGDRGSRDEQIRHTDRGKVRDEERGRDTWDRKTREVEIEVVGVAETATEIETGTVTVTETGITH
jgi:hypothetical protein